MKTIYIVKAIGGSWGDTWESNIIAVPTKERAEELAQQYQKENDELSEDAHNYMDDLSYNVSHLRDVYNTEDGAYECSEDCLACKYEDFVYMDMDATYLVEALEMED